ncbi:hypothetical protein [Paenibacillus beijingensis]|nr:hypothetical protein [Paenibacillus beijingensis]
MMRLGRNFYRRSEFNKGANYEITKADASEAVIVAMIKQAAKLHKNF